MSDNVLQTTQKLVQDVLAPDVRETKVRLEAFGHETNSRFEAMQKQIDFRFDGIQKQIESLSKENEAHYRGILAAISESRAQSELVGLAAVAALRERIAVLEARAA